MSHGEMPELTELPSVVASLKISENWKDANGDKDNDSTTDEEDVADEDGGDWGDEDEIIQPDPVSCFFCDVPPASPERMLEHCKSHHGCDLVAWVKKRSLPTEDIIKMVNYIRKERPPAAVFAKNNTDLPLSTWSSEHYMLPVCAEDHGITSLLIWDWSEPDLPAELYPAPSLVGSKPHLSTLMAGGDATTDKEHSRDVDDARNVDYFDSYSGFNIHCEMLRDKVRTETYRAAITATVKDKVVLDIGCGSGVLSCFAAQSGATAVVAVDKADIIDYAHEIARVNGLANKIQFVHGDLDRLKLPVDIVDVIVSEWMGYFLLFEGMLDSVIAARDKYLAPSGTMIPSTASLYLTAVSDEEDWKSTVGLWDNAYGLKFDCLKQHTLRYPSVHAVDPTSVITSRLTLRSFDLMKCQVADLDFKTETEFVPTKSCNITALVGFFDVGYHGIGQEHKVMFCTSPGDTTTHWAQSVFYLDNVFPVAEGVPVTITADIRKTRLDKRGLTVSFSMKTAGSAEWRQTYEL